MKIQTQFWLHNSMLISMLYCLVNHIFTPKIGLRPCLNLINSSNETSHVLPEENVSIAWHESRKNI